MKKQYLRMGWLIITVAIAVVFLHSLQRVGAASANLFAGYSFNEGTGTTISDSSGNNNNASVFGAMWTTSGRYGSGLSFSGNGRVTGPSISLGPTFTFEAWINNPSHQPYETILTVGSNRVFYLNNGLLTFYDGATERSFGSALSSNAWHHVALTYDGAVLRAYVNGVQHGSTQSATLAPYTGVLQVGAWLTGGSSVDFFSGVIDEVHVYNRTLSITEIQSDMVTPLVGFAAPPPAPAPPPGPTPPPPPPPPPPTSGCPGFLIEGFGRATTGGCGGRIIYVTNLSDSGPGSLRDAVNQTGARIVKFQVSGTIVLSSTLTIANSDITIDGSDAPGGGIAIRGGGIEVDGGNRTVNNVIIRHIRIRPGPITYDGGVVDGISIRSASNVVVDHVSASWATDENISSNAGSNITIQWSMIAEGLSCPGNRSDGECPHSYGGLFGPYTNNVTLHHNLYASNWARNPLLEGGRFQLINNVIYNANRATHADWDPSFPNIQLDAVGNYYKGGPNSDLSRAEIHSPNDDAPASWFTVYPSGNIGWHRPTDSGAQSLVIDPFNEGPAATRITIRSTPFTMPSNVITSSADTAYLAVLANAGATLPCRDSVDTRIVNGVQTGTGRFIDIPSEVGGWPALSCAGTPPPAPSTKFLVGDRVQTLANLNVRSSPSTSGTLLGTQPAGIQGTVIGGPTAANALNWWQINYDTGADGWSVEDYLDKVSAPPPPPPDTIAPTVSLTAPVNNSTVSGTITISATASDNVGIAGVQFFIDGNALGSEDTSSPYSISWNTAQAGNGIHTLLASARDAAGNRTSSTLVTVTVSNVVAPTSSVATPVITPSGGSFTSAQLITINSPTSGATVRYTLDGSDPSLSSPQYTGPFLLSSSATVKAKASKVGMLDSGVASASFAITFPSVTVPRFAVGQRIQVSQGSADVRALPTTASVLLGSQPINAAGVVVSTSTVSNGFTWWNIDYDTGVDGWSIEASLTSSTLPLPTPSAPTISSFFANPSDVSAGSFTTLSWAVSGATTLSIDQGVGSMTGLTSKAVAPSQTTVYTLTASNSTGATIATTTITVRSGATTPPPAPVPPPPPPVSSGGGGSPIVPPAPTGSSGGGGGSVVPPRSVTTTQPPTVVAPPNRVAPPPPTVSVPQPGPSAEFSRNLTLGSRGDDVRALQMFLNARGFLVASFGPGSPGQETTYFGPATARSLAAFQRVQGITPAVGFFGQITRANVEMLNREVSVPPAEPTPPTSSVTAEDLQRQIEFLREQVRILLERLGTSGR